MAALLEYPVPAAVWSNRLIVFDKDLSNAQNIILSQGRYALLALINRIDRLYELLRAIPGLIEFYPHPEIPQVLSELCYHQGVASNILLNDSGPRRDEHEIEHKMRLERYRYTRRFCDGQKIPTDVLRDRKVRNRLTHIDEYLFKAMRRPNNGFCIDSAIGRRDQFKAPDGIDVVFCRTFIAAEEKILHLGTEISVPHLRAEAEAVLGVVFGVKADGQLPDSEGSPQSVAPPPSQTEA